MTFMSWAIVVYAPAQELNAKININHSQIQGTDVSVFEELKDKLEVFLKINEYNILKDNGKIKREIADKLALDEYKKYRILQDENYISDFDELVIETKNLNNI